MLTVNVLARASFHYTLGIRGCVFWGSSVRLTRRRPSDNKRSRLTPHSTNHRFFLAAPLVSWMFGSWLLLGTTVFYICGVYMMEEDFLLNEEVRSTTRLASLGLSRVDPNPLNRDPYRNTPLQVWSPLPGSLSAASLAMLEQEEQQRGNTAPKADGVKAVHTV